MFSHHTQGFSLWRFPSFPWFGSPQKNFSSVCYSIPQRFQFFSTQTKSLHNQAPKINKRDPYIENGKKKFSCFHSLDNFDEYSLTIGRCSSSKKLNSNTRQRSDKCKHRMYLFLFFFSLCYTNTTFKTSQSIAFPAFLVLLF
jgi:hypothetical protein